MSSQTPVRAFERYLEQAGKALVSASPQHACALLTNAVTQFEIVMGNPGSVTAGAIAGMQIRIRSLAMLASEGERIASTWLEVVAPAAQIQRSGGVDIYG